MSKRGPCPYCGRALLKVAGSKCYPTKDHVRPQWDGGTFTLWVCFECNHDKGGLFLHQWLIVLRRRNDKRLTHVEKIAERYPNLARPSTRLSPLAPDGTGPTDAQKLMVELLKRGEGASREPVTCTCGKVCSDQASLKQHLMAAKGAFPCEVCCKSFKNSSRLVSHLWGKHRIVNQPFGCETCGRIFKSDAALAMHAQASHAGPRVCVVHSERPVA